MAKYLDYSGVLTLWNKIKQTSKNKIDNIIVNSGFLSDAADTDYSSNDVILKWNVKKYNSDGEVVSATPDISELSICSATSSTAGLMSSTDKTKLDSISQTDINNLKALSTKISQGYTPILIKN